MNDETEHLDDDETVTDATGERIAKVLARAGLGSRRDAEKMIADRRVSVNGRVLVSPAVNVLPSDVVAVDGEALRAAQETRVWRYHKPAGLVTTHKDPQGRTTVFAVLPRDLPHVVSVGRLDLNSEGLLLLTNDGSLAGMLEHPSTGWPRRYRVRMHGRVDMDKLATLADGVEVDGIQYGPIQVTFERQQGMNAWLQVTLHEGKNREIRRVMEHLGYTVNRLIRVAYGPFVIGRLQKGQVEEVPFKVLREALAGMGEAVPPALRMDKIDSSKWAKAKPKPVRPGYKKFQRQDDEPKGPQGGSRPQGNRRDGDRPQGDRPYGASRPQGEGRDGDRPRGDRPYGAGRPQGDRQEGDRPRGDRPHGAGRPQGEGRDGDRPRGDRPYGAGRPQGDRQEGDRPRGDRPHGAGRPQGEGRDGDRPRGDRPYGAGRPQGDRQEGDRPRGDRPHGAGRPQGNRRDGDRPQGDRPYGAGRPQGDRRDGDRPQGDRPYGAGRPQGNRRDGDRPQGDRPYGAGRPQGDRRDGNRPQGGRPSGSRPSGSRPTGGSGPRGPRKGDR
ncbi:pseudouridine synthase [Insolitispirillum peregrinum]|uniref:pseudouridine synthase n=1 Tax=Insolitispirillum peregrinum TaxID=80876 RepID=UPI00360FD877